MPNLAKLQLQCMLVVVTNAILIETSFIKVLIRCKWFLSMVLNEIVDGKVFGIFIRRRYVVLT